MKFLILTQYFPPEIGAAQTRLSAMAQHLSSRGHEVNVITAFPNYPEGRIFEGYEKGFYRFEHMGSVRVHRVWLYAAAGAGMKRLLNYFSFCVTCLIAIFKQSHVDCLFIESPPLFLSVPGLGMARFRRIPSIFNVADLWPDSVVDMGLMKRGVLIGLAEKLERWAYRKATYVTAVTEGIRRSLLEKKQVPAEKLLFLPNGVDLEQFRSRQPDEALRLRLGLVGKKIVLYQGTQGFAHGLSSVLYTAQLLSDDPDIHFLFLGDGSERPMLEALRAELGLSNVTFHDPVPMAVLPGFFSISECGLVSLRDTPLFRGARPAKVNPILGSAKPIIFFGRGEGADLVQQAGAGIVVNHGNQEELAAAVREIVRNPELARQLGQNGRRYAEQQLSWPALIDNWLEQFGVEMHPTETVSTVSP